MMRGVEGAEGDMSRDKRPWKQVSRDARGGRQCERDSKEIIRERKKSTWRKNKII